MKKIRYFREKIIIAGLLLIFIILTGVHRYVSSYYNEDKGFEWLSLARTTNNLPVMFAKCSLHHTGYYENNCERNVMLYGDDSGSAINCGGTGLDVQNELYPDSLRILYYSFNENKFYGGNFRLDYNKIQAIAEKMRNAVQQGSKSIVFETKVYPKGKVVVSIESYIKTSIEKKTIGSFQTEQVNHDWSVFANESSISERGVSKSTSITVQRALLLSKYNWQVNVILPKDCSINNLDVNVYGNRSLKMDTIINATVPTFTNFVYLPQELYLEWKRKDTIKFGTGFYFDEKEIIKAFETINKGNNNLPISMHLIVKNDTTALRAMLIGNGKSIELKNTEHSKIWNEKIYH